MATYFTVKKIDTEKNIYTKLIPIKPTLKESK